MNCGTELEQQMPGNTARVAWIVSGVAVFAIAVAVGLRLRQGSAAQRTDGGVSPQILAQIRRAWEAGRYAEVVNSLRAVPDDVPFAAEARFLEGRALWKLNRWQAAERLWKRALELDPRVPEAGWHLLRFYYVEQRWREVEQLALQLYDVEPDPRDQTLLLLELVRVEHERLTPAETALMLEPVVALEPQNYHALRTLGMSYVQLHRTSEGIALLERTLGLEPSDSENWHSLAWCLYETGNRQSLGELWNEMPAAIQDEPRILRLRAMWTESVGDLAEAERWYRKVLTRDPVDRKAHYQLARLLRRRGEEHEANEHESLSTKIDRVREEMGTCYTQASQQNDNPSAELCRQFGRLCRELDRMRQAERWEQEAIRRSSTSDRQSSSSRAVGLPMRENS